MGVPMNAMNATNECPAIKFSCYFCGLRIYFKKRLTAPPLKADIIRLIQIRLSWVFDFFIIIRCCIDAAEMEIYSMKIKYLLVAMGFTLTAQMAQADYSHDLQAVPLVQDVPLKMIPSDIAVKAPSGAGVEGKLVTGLEGKFFLKTMNGRISKATLLNIPADAVTPITSIQDTDTPPPPPAGGTGTSTVTLNYETPTTRYILTIQFYYINNELVDITATVKSFPKNEIEK